MSTWRKISKDSLSVDGEDIEVLIDSDENGNNYVVISVEDVNDLLDRWVGKDKS